MRDWIINGVGLGGFCAMSVGLWLFSPALSLTVCGGVMLAGAVYAAIPRKPTE